MRPLLALIFALALSACASTAGVRSEVGDLRAPDGTGSGVVIAPGFVLTARHVAVIDGLHFRGHKMKGAKLKVGYGDVDLGLLYFPKTVAACPCVKLADYEAQPDETIYVVGYPLGIAQMLTIGQSQGVREHTLVPGGFGEPEDLGRRLMMSVTAAPGNSGGGVFVKRRGEYQLVGILVEGGSGLAFAVPLADIRPFIAGVV